MGLQEESGIRSAGHVVVKDRDYWTPLVRTDLDGTLMEMIRCHEKFQLSECVVPTDLTKIRKVLWKDSLLMLAEHTLFDHSGLEPVVEYQTAADNWGLQIPEKDPSIPKEEPKQDPFWKIPRCAPQKSSTESVSSDNSNLELLKSTTRRKAVPQHKLNHEKLARIRETIRFELARIRLEGEKKELETETEQPIKKRKREITWDPSDNEVITDLIEASLLLYLNMTSRRN